MHGCNSFPHRQFDKGESFGKLLFSEQMLSAVEVSEYIFMLNEGFYNKFTSPSEIDNIVVDNIETLFAGFHTESVVYL